MNKIQEQTQAYWRLSSIHNGRIDASLTTQDALLALKDILERTGPKRRLRNIAGLLMANIICPKRKRKPKKVVAPTPLASFHKQQSA